MSEEKRGSVSKWVNKAGTAVGLVLAFVLGGLLWGREAPQLEHSSGEHDAAAQLWTCSMHPQVRASEPGQCPICGMDLIPLDDHVGEATSPRQIVLSESAKIRARIRTTPVKLLTSGTVERRLLGRVDYDETRLRTITSWIGGRIDRLQVKTTGQRVGRGQSIATLYSPEVFSAHQDLLVAKQQEAKLAGATESARIAAQAALEASRDRLRLLGVPAPEIAAMEKAKRPSEQVSIRSPFSGTVLERLATEGSYVQTGTGLYQVADLSRLWVQLDAYESDLPLLKVGQEVSLKVEALPTEQFEGRVTFVDPVLNQRTRTTRVRIEVKNSNGQLRPGMFAEAVVRGSSGPVDANALVIPETAPLFTGRRSIVYVEVPGSSSPTYEARVVRLGPKMGDVYPVIAGLSEGEAVVVHGAFALDADLQIRGGLSMMSSPDDHEDGPYEQIVAVPNDYKEPLGTVLSAYLAVQEALASDDLEAAKRASKALVAGADAVRPTSPEPFVQAWSPLHRQLSAYASSLAEATNLEGARLAFRDLSQQVATLLRVFGNPTSETVRLASCPMAIGGEGAEWVQRASVIENPYFGASMHSCGEVHNVVEHGTYLPLPEGESSVPAPSEHGGHEH